MKVDQFQAYMMDLFGDLLIQFRDTGEYGVNYTHEREIKKIGYCTNLTPETILQAQAKGIDFIITHHDAWDFVYGMKEECIRMLRQFEIGHYFAHLPLDYADFGTCSSLMKELGVVNVLRQSCDVNGESVIGIGELSTAMEFIDLVNLASDRLQEIVRAWNFGGSTIRRIGILTGAGNGTTYIRDAAENQCDVYITGEKTLYTIQYAKFMKMNLIVGSHTFTEIFGVRSLAVKIRDKFSHVIIDQLYEEHIE